MHWQKFEINQDYLKIYALVAMTIDHAAKILALPYGTFLSETIGRTAYPIFAFLLMYHLFSRQIFARYTARLSVFAVISYAALFPFEPSLRLNILFSLLFPVLTLWALTELKKERRELNAVFYYYLAAMIFIFAMFGAFMADYSLSGLFFMLGLYAAFQYKNAISLALVFLSCFFLNFTWSWQLLPVAITLLTTLFLFNVDMQTKRPRILKHWWVFYLYFPAHKLILYGIEYMVKAG